MIVALLWLAIGGVPSLQPGAEAPAGLEVVTVADSKRMTLDYAAAPVTIVDFFATWCPQCREAMGHYAELLAEHGDRVRVVVVDVQEPYVVARRYFRENPPPPGVEVVFDPSGNVLRRFSPQKYPSFYVIDRSGRIRYLLQGWGNRGAATLKKWLRRLDAPGGPAALPAAAARN